MKNYELFSLKERKNFDEKIPLLFKTYMKDYPIVTLNFEFSLENIIK